MGNTFHQTAVTHEYISVVVNDVMPGLLNCTRHDLFSARAKPTAHWPDLGNGPGGGLQEARV